MKEQRRHQRIRFNTLPTVRIGQFGMAGSGVLENLSLGGLMLRTDLSLKVGDACGCEFVVGGFVLAYPADPAGPAQETAGCRCSIVGVR